MSYKGDFGERKKNMRINVHSSAQRKSCAHVGMQIPLIIFLPNVKSYATLFLDIGKLFCVASSTTNTTVISFIFQIILTNQPIIVIIFRILRVILTFSANIAISENKHRYQCNLSLYLLFTRLQCVYEVDIAVK